MPARARDLSAGRNKKTNRLITISTETETALDSGTLGTRVVTDLDQLTQSRTYYLETYRALDALAGH